MKLTLFAHIFRNRIEPGLPSHEANVKHLVRLLALGVLVLATLPSISPVVAQTALYCQPGQTPAFTLGFATLKAQLGFVMGDPTECEHANSANGDTLQTTATGLAFYRNSTNTPTFTNGFDHWALTDNGLVYWTGDAIDPSPSAGAPPSPGPSGGTSPVPAPTPTPKPLTEADITAAVSPSVVEIGTTGDHGSGVRIADGIITNAHVVDGVSTLQVATFDHQIAPATVLRIDRNADLALLDTNLSIPSLDMEFIGQQRQGDEVLVLGYPLDLRVSVGGQATLTRGLISGTGTQEGTGRALIQTDAAVNPGNSGGAMVNARGKLIGVPTFGITDAQNINFAVAADTISAFLNAPQSAVAPSPPKPTSTPTPTPAPIRYAAIAFDATTGAFGWSWNDIDLSSAENAARASCGRPGCGIVQWVGGPGYVALATGNGGGWGTSGVQPTRSAAEAQALATCSLYTLNCTVVASVPKQ